MTPPTARTAREKAHEAFTSFKGVGFLPTAALDAALSAFESSLLEDLIERAERDHGNVHLPTVDRVDASGASRWLRSQLPSPPLKEDQPTE